MMQGEKKRCILGCPKIGFWLTGICPGCRSYMKKAKKRPLGWRIARRQQVSVWIVRLDRVNREMRGRRHG